MRRTIIVTGLAVVALVLALLLTAYLNRGGSGGEVASGRPKGSGGRVDESEVVVVGPLVITAPSRLDVGVDQPLKDSVGKTNGSNGGGITHIDGFVRDAAGRPIEGATVCSSTNFQEACRTDQVGRFRVGVPTPEDVLELKLVCQHPRFSPKSTALAIFPGQPVEHVEIVLDYGSSLCAIVQSTEGLGVAYAVLEAFLVGGGGSEGIVIGGDAARGIRARAQTAAGGVVIRGKGDALGVVCVDGLSAGTYVVTIRHPDYGTWRLEGVDVGARDAIDLGVARLGLGRVFEGTVLIKGGRVAMGAKVEALVATDYGRTDCQVVSTDAEGRFLICGIDVEAQTCELRATLAGYMPTTDSQVWLDDPNYSLELMNEITLILKDKLSDRSLDGEVGVRWRAGDVKQGRLASVYCGKYSDSWSQIAVNDGGRCIIDAMPETSSWLQVARRGYFRRSLSPRALGRGVVQVELTPSPELRLVLSSAAWGGGAAIPAIAVASMGLENDDGLLSFESGPVAIVQEDGVGVCVIDPMEVDTSMGLTVQLSVDGFKPTEAVKVKEPGCAFSFEVLRITLEESE